MKEYTFRYGKHHVAERLIPFLSFPPNNMPKGVVTPMPQCMPEQYKVIGDSIQAYHNYYINDKQPFAVWTNRPIPSWYVREWRNRKYCAVSLIDKNKVKFKMIPA
jgi:hypothetical protein